MKKHPWRERVEIGPATLYLGDFRAIMPTIEAESVDMIMTDPPYGHNNNNNDLIQNMERALGRSKAGRPRPIKNDGKEADPMFRALLAESARALKHRGCCCCCCCGGGGPDPTFARWALWMDDALKFKQAVVWDKGKIGLGWHYRRSYEFVLVAEKKGKGKGRWYDTTKRVENILRSCGDSRIRKIIPSKDQHPTEKPPELAVRFIGLHTMERDVVLDPMMGSGAFGVAAVGMKRRFFGIELDKKWFKVACQRIEEEHRKATNKSP